jgi:hypothetical protein
MLQNQMKFFKDRKIIIATQHQKEKVIAPLLKSHFNLNPFVSPIFDTDRFGTFSGEIERKESALNTVRIKCLAAMEEFDYDLGIASEGSFGPHPTLFFGHADDELILLIDKKNNLEIIAREVSLETNFNASIISSFSELTDFANKALFPSHGLILKAKNDSDVEIFKGIQTLEELEHLYNRLRNSFSTVEVETDMRAHLNPTRMRVIEKTMQKLIEKMKCFCPNCQMPGFDVKERIKGLPCDCCKRPTQSTMAFRYECVHCSYSELKNYPNIKTVESPEFCDYCNP